MDINSEFLRRYDLQNEYLGSKKRINLIIPKVSVLVTTYQQKHFIGKCLDGILMQKTDFPFEIIIGEDGSIDGTREICMQYAQNHKDKIRLYLRDRELSQYYDENGKFISRFNARWNLVSSRGMYICICEGDDFWTDSNKLQKQVDFLDENTDYGLVYSDIEIIDNNGDKIKNDISYNEVKDIYKSGIIFWDLMERNFINTLTVCGRRRYYMDYINAPGYEEFAYDLRYWLYFSLRTKIKFIDEKMANYRIHDSGISRNNDFFLKRKPLVMQSALLDFISENKGIVEFDQKIFSSQLLKLILNKNLSKTEKKPIHNFLLNNPKYMVYVLKALILKFNSRYGF